MRIKLILATSLLCAGMNAHAQNYNPSPIPCKKITPTLLNNYNGTIDANCIEDENNTNTDININGNQNVELKAGEEINLDGEVWVNPNANGNFYAHINPSNIGLAWYQPYDTPGEVIEYDKLEIGIDLPANVKNEINNFINNAGINKLNPFNPEQVDVKAEFWRNTNTNGTGTWNGPMKVYGFYYEEFIENADPSVPIDDWSLVPVASEHKFRVRFAPPQDGLWRCKITVTINQNVVHEASEFTFNVLNSSNPGYVKVGSNNLYLQVGNETYLPISRNIPEPDMRKPSDGGIWNTTYDLYNLDQNINGYDNRKINPAFHKAYRDELSLYKNAGGDEYRFVNFADWYEIEFEKLNNYYDRLNSAWELDRLVEHSSNIGLKMYFNMQNHEAFQWVGDYSRKWDWPAHDDIIEDQSLPTCYSYDQNDLGYCYRSDPTYGVDTPEEFLTDEESKKYYKYRLRYITSRWGYSTNISLFEIRSEMNNHAKYQLPVLTPNPEYDPSNPNSTEPEYLCPKSAAVYKYYTNEDNFLGKVSDWNNEMAEYLKTHQYYSHLLSVDYTGNPRDIWINNGHYYAMLNGDESYYSQYVDIAAYNDYPGEPPITRFKGQVVTNLDLNHVDNPYFAEYKTLKINKPVLLGETGYEPAQYCDNGIEFIKDLWISPFTGHANASNQWHYQHNYDLIVHHSTLKNFIYGINFSSIKWEPFFDERADNKAATYCLISNENMKRAIGIIENRTVNYYTMGCSNKLNPGEDYELELQVQDGNANDRLMLDGMGILARYDVDWYDALTGFQIGSTEDRRANFAGRLRLEHPKLADAISGYTSGTAPLIAFKIRRHNEPSFLSENDSLIRVDNFLVSLEDSDETLTVIEETDWGVTEPKITKNEELVITPNPASSIITIAFNNELVNAKLKIATLQNSVLYNSNLTVNSLNIDISAFSPGSYLVIIENNGKLYSEKFIKQ